MIFRAQNWDTLVACCQKIIFFDFDFSTFTKLVFGAGIIAIIIVFLLLFNKKNASATKHIILFDYLGLVSKMKMRYWFVCLVVLGIAILLISPAATPEFIYFAF